MTLMTDLFPKRAARSLLAELARGVWAESPERVESLVADVAARIAISSSGIFRVAANTPSMGTPVGATTIHDGVAHVPIQGHIVKERNWLLEALGVPHTSIDSTRANLKAALASDQIHSIVLDVNSPGGVAVGIQDLADDIHAAGKPVHARIDGEALSAAYWIASQADTVTATGGSLVGSIGVYGVVADSSKAAEKNGIKVHALRSSELKGGAIAGTEVTEPQLKEMQSFVDRAAAHFSGSVRRGRALDADGTAAVANGRTWFAAEALDLGLIDSIVSAVPATAAGPAPASPPSEEEEMEAKELAAQQAATLAAELQTLRAEKAKSDALMAEATAQLVANTRMLEQVKAQRKEEILQAGVQSGRITPAGLPALQKFAATVETDELSAFVGALPQFTRPHAAGSSPADQRGAGGSVVPMNREERAFLAGIGLTEEDLATYAGKNAIGSDGKLYAVGSRAFDEADQKERVA